MELVLPDLKTIPVAQRLEVMEQILDSIEDDPDELPAEAWQLQEIERRIASYGGKLEGEDWQVVLQRMKERNGQTACPQ